MNIQWYPGHMTKTRRQMENDIRLVDAVCEIVDARIPMSSRNPDIDSICGSKPRLMILNRIDMADPEETKKWAAYFRAQGMVVLETDCKNRKGTNQFAPKVKQLLKDKIQQNAAKGMVGKTIRVMIVGIPNVGKSTLINQVAGRKSAKAENRPGVTRGKQWVTVEKGLELLDTPGILWPKFEDPQVGLKLSYTGAIKDDVVDIETLACNLIDLLGRKYPQVLEQRYKITVPEEFQGYELLKLCGRKRGMLISGGEVDTERMSRVLLEEYRSGKLGKFTFESPEDLGGDHGEEGI